MLCKGKSDTWQHNLKKLSLETFEEITNIVDIRVSRIWLVYKDHEYMNENAAYT